TYARCGPRPAGAGPGPPVRRARPAGPDQTIASSRILLAIRIAVFHGPRQGRAGDVVPGTHPRPVQLCPMGRPGQSRLEGKPGGFRLTVPKRSAFSAGVEFPERADWGMLGDPDGGTGGEAIPPA